MSYRALFTAFLTAIFACVEVGAAKPLPDTAGARLREVWTQARRKYRDALLVSISGRTGPDGIVNCSARDPMQNGWRYTFYSPKKKEYLMMGECLGSIAGPLRQLMNQSKKAHTISGRFLDSELALGVMEKAGNSLDPDAYGARGKRPFLLTLYRLPDERFAEHPPVWKISVGPKTFLIDAQKNEIFKAERYGVQLEGVDISTAPVFPDVLKTRPKRQHVYTAKQDLERVLRYATQKFPGSRLMAVEGFTDAWGGSPCTGPGDGWAYYFYFPRNRDYEAVYACNGYIGPGPTRYVPLDRNVHTAISGRFLDSDAIVDKMLLRFGNVMDESLNGKFKRTGTLLLRNYRVTPFGQSGLWDIKLIWEMTLGRTRYRIDAVTGKVIDVRE